MVTDDPMRARATVWCGRMAKNLEIKHRAFIQQVSLMGRAKPRVGTPSKYPPLPESSLEFAKPGMFAPDGRLL